MEGEREASDCCRREEVKLGQRTAWVKAEKWECTLAKEVEAAGEMVCGHPWVRRWSVERRPGSENGTASPPKTLALYL